MCCVVTKFIYANTIILFNLGEQWLLEYWPPRFAGYDDHDNNTVKDKWAQTFSK